MKRINKVDSLVGKELLRENGEIFTFTIEEVGAISNDRLDGRTYTVIDLSNGYKIYYRNTAQCTFYQIFEEEIIDFSEPYVEEVVEIEEPVPNLDPNLLTFDDGEGEDVVDFYSKDFEQLITLENENAMVFGFVEKETNLVYVPIGSKDNMVEVCQVYRLDDLRDIVVEGKSIYGDLVNLNINNRKFDANTYELSCKTKHKIYNLNKQNIDMVVKVQYRGEDAIGFVDGDKIIVPITTKTSFFEVMNVIESDLNNTHYEVLYKKYVKQKSTTGITDIDYTDVFSYFKY